MMIDLITRLRSCDMMDDTVIGDEAADALEAKDAELERLTAVLDRLARLGNEPHFGNSDGNMIARAALKGDDDAQ